MCVCVCVNETTMHSLFHLYLGIWLEIAEALRIVTILKGTSQDKQILGSKSCQQGYDTGIAANA